MLCSNCGKELPDGSAFCSGCGNKIKIQKKKKSFLIPFVITLILLIATLVVVTFAFILPGSISSSKGSVYKAEGKGFNSADEALEEYIDALKAGDVDRMLSCFAIESVVDNFDEDAYIDRLQALNPLISTGDFYPSDGETLRSLNVERRKAYLTRNILFQIFVLAQKDLFTNGMPRSALEFDSIDEMEKELLPSKVDKMLSSIELVKIADPEKELDLDFDNLKSYEKKIREMYGYEDVEYMLAIIKCDGDKFYMLIDAAMYDGKWYILNPYGTIATLYGLVATTGGIAPEEDILRKKWF